MSKAIPTIAIYQTNEYGFHMFGWMIEKIIAKQDQKVAVTSISADDIRNNALSKDKYIGLIMPGRNRGQDYRDELGDAGCAAIQNATQEKGLGMMAVCAGSYILSREVNWCNEFVHAGNKIVTNNHALFQGKAIGAFNDLWKGGYRSDAEKPDIYTSNILSLKVVDVAFNFDKNSKGHAVYWGGGAFLPDAGSNQAITVLVQHQAMIDVPNVSNMNADPYHFENPAAVIEFECGKGKVIFSNIHPEMTSTQFTQLFPMTPQARKNPVSFAEDAEKLALSTSQQEAIFSRFLDNCLKNTVSRNIAAKNLLPKVA